MKQLKNRFSAIGLTFFLFLLIANSNAKSFAQELIPYEEPLASRMEKSKKIVQEAEFIFEGIYISETVQHTENHNLSIVKSKFLVQHVYKGNLKLGTVIIEQMGPVAHFITEIKKDIYGKEYEWITAVGTNLTSHSRGQDYSKYNTTIFFCNAKQLPDVVNDSIDNKEILEFIPSKPSTVNFANYNPEFEFFEMGGLHNLLFKTKADFYKFLQESDSTIVLPLTESERAKRDSLIFMNRIERRNKTLDSLRKEFSKPSNDGKGKLIKKIGNIDYSIVNLQLTSTSTERFFEFDVYTQVNQTNTFFESSVLTFTYNTAVFGSDLGINNIDIITTKSPFLGSNNVLNVGNLQSNEILFDFYYDYLQAQPRSQLPSTPVLLFHVKMKIKPSNCGSNPTLAFSNLQQNSNQSAYNSSPSGFGTFV